MAEVDWICSSKNIYIGNTNIVIGIHDGGSWIEHWRIKTDTEKMPDEYSVIFNHLFNDAKQNDELSEVEQALLKLNLDELSPKQAMDELYKLLNLLHKN